MAATPVIQAGSRLGRYELIEKLAEGGMGVVWSALDTQLEREVALKFLPDAVRQDPDRLARLSREAKAVAALNHPNIVTLHSLEQESGLTFLAMERVRGHTLAEQLPAEGLPYAKVIEIAIPLAEAVGAAHERGIIHRDLKPANVMVNDAGQVKILDFGLARPRPAAWSADSRADTLPAGAAPSGTIAYMSPEQLCGRPVDHRSDLFSLGAMLYELCTGRPAFHGATFPELAAAILESTPPPVHELHPDIPSALGRVIEHCLEKDVRQRLQSAHDLKVELEDVRRDPDRHVAAQPSIAVLPFADLSRERDQGYFCDGMAEEVLQALAGVPGLRLASRTATLQFRDSDCDPREIGRRLAVGALLVGSVRKQGNRLRISVELVDTARGFRRWSEVYDRALDDVFEIQAEIATSVVRALAITLSPGEYGALEKPAARDALAYDYYLRGRRFFYRYGRRDMEFALQLFSRAIELDPGYARAHAGIADCWSYLFMYAEGGETGRARAEAASERAIACDATLPEAHASRGFALSLRCCDLEAEGEFQRALQLGPQVFEACYFYARHCFARGRLDEAARFFERAAQARPEDYQSLLLVAQVHESLGRSVDAHDARRRGLHVVEEHLKRNPDDTRAMYMMANALVALGEVEQGLQLLDRALKLGPREGMLLYNAGCILALAGRTSEALDTFEEAVGAGLNQKGWFENDSNLDPLRTEPRFIALMETLDRAAATAGR